MVMKHSKIQPPARATTEDEAKEMGMASLKGREVKKGGGSRARAPKRGNEDRGMGVWWLGGCAVAKKEVGRGEKESETKVHFVILARRVTAADRCARQKSARPYLNPVHSKGKEGRRAGKKDLRLECRGRWERCRGCWDGHGNFLSLFLVLFFHVTTEQEV